jgi:prepilin-type N-terminal cleavage/methylation domain-containing protein
MAPVARSESGFTLLEIVVAVFIVAVMTAVIVPHLLGAGQRAESVACEENQRVIRAALAEYDLIHNAYPTGNTMSQLEQLRNDDILQSIPTEPAGGYYIINDVDGNHVEVSCDVHGELGQ